MTDGRYVSDSRAAIVRQSGSLARVSLLGVLIAGSAYSSELAHAPTIVASSEPDGLATVLASFSTDVRSAVDERGRHLAREALTRVDPIEAGNGFAPEQGGGTDEPSRLTSLARFGDWEALEDHWRWDRLASLEPVAADHAAATPANTTDGVLVAASILTSFEMPISTASLDPSAGLRFPDVGFPHIERNDRPDSVRYKPYEPVITYRRPIAGVDYEQPIALVRCMGLNPEQVAERADRFEALVVDRAMKYKVSASLIKAVITRESCFDPEARSHVGAVGLMQLMPATADWLGVADPLDPADNVDGGVRYLAYLGERFDELPHVLAAYNAGPANVVRYDGIPPFDETENYVSKVMAYYRRYGIAHRVASRR